MNSDFSMNGSVNVGGDADQVLVMNKVSVQKGGLGVCAKDVAVGTIALAVIAAGLTQIVGPSLQYLGDIFGGYAVNGYAYWGIVSTTLAMLCAGFIVAALVVPALGYAWATRNVTGPSVPVTTMEEYASANALAVSHQSAQELTALSAPAIAR